MRKVLFILTLVLVIAFMITGCGGSDSESEEPVEESKGDAVAGEPLFQGTCSACHGPDAKGLPNLGKDLTTSEFLKENTDDELLDFILVGRPISDPLNTQGVDMPPKGGNPSLTNDDIYDIIAYLRSIEQ